MTSIFTSDNDGTEDSIACRVAYVIDNDQPVLCTFIGNQPLFYADEIDIDSEEEQLLEEELAASDLLFRLTHRDLQDKAIQLKKKKQAFVDENRLDVCDAFDVNMAGLTASSKPASIKKLIATMNLSRLGRELLCFAANNGVEIVTSDETADIIYDKEISKILVPSSVEEGTAIIGIAQELRRVWQHKQGVLLNPLMFLPDDAIIVNRAQIADLCIAKIRVAWELSLENEKGAWQAIASSGLHDIAYTLIREVRTDFRCLNNGWAMQMAFEKWFLSDRCKLEDKKLIQTMLADHGGHVFESEETSQMVSIDIITRLGEMPFGKNYLSGFAGSIIGDPLYTEVRDRSSANFLWFIKFESSFRDKERDLKTEQNSDITKPHIRTTLFEDLEEEGHEEEGFGAVVAFPGGVRSRGAKAQVQRSSRGGNVITLFREDHDA